VAHPEFVKGYNAGRRVRYAELRKRREPSREAIEAHNARLRADNRAKRATAPQNA
jgi:hypothetical protein